MRISTAALATVALALTAGCATPVVPVVPPPSPAPNTAPGLRVLPASSHVTGTPYPSHCVRALGADPGLPVAACTPGSIRSDVTQATIGQTICVRGWTSTVRPPESETAPVKTAAMRAYGIPAGQRGAVELDHYVPLELGGSSDVGNLWPEPSDWPNHPRFAQNHKDAVEDALWSAVCSHKVSLAAAQQAIATDWRTAVATLGIRP